MSRGAAGELEAVIVGAAAELAGVERTNRGAEMELATRGTTFAAVSGDRAEFRLAPPVVAAALRTPGTQPSARGADWVAFAPSELDDHAIDRAEAWLASAWRRVGTGA